MFASLSLEMRAPLPYLRPMRETPEEFAELWEAMTRLEAEYGAWCEGLRGGDAEAIEAGLADFWLRSGYDLGDADVEVRIRTDLGAILSERPVVTSGPIWDTKALSAAARPAVAG
jgi:hypothetical protein